MTLDWFEERMSEVREKEMLAIAEKQAAIDRDMLARLVATGKAQRDVSEYEASHLVDVRPFVADMTRRVAALRGPRVNLAIRPKSKRRRR